MTDEELIGKIVRNPSHGLSKAIDEYGDTVKYIVKGILGKDRQQDTEECISDVFTELWRAVTVRKESISSVRAYLTGIAKNKAVDRLRKVCNISDKEVASLIEDYSDEPEVSGRDGVYTDLCDTLSDKETAGAILEEIKTLPEEDKTYATDRFCHGKSVNEIAAARNTSPRHVTRRLYECRRKLREALFRKGMVSQDEK